MAGRLLAEKLAKRAGSKRTLTARLGIRKVEVEELKLRRVRRGKAFSYVSENGTRIKEARTLRRLASLAVPPAYQDVRYAQDPAAHIQAVGRDDAGRIQYRYHPEWVKVREQRKARHLAVLVAALPRIRRALTQRLADRAPSREFALAAAIELVASTAIRAGGENYAREHGTRGAATLLKSNVTTSKGVITLAFRAKGGKAVRKEVAAPRLAAAIRKLQALPGRRLFQYRDDDGLVRQVRANDINAFLREVAAVRISLKDFRTLCASALVLDLLAREEPAASVRGRRRQVRVAVESAAQQLENTPAICRRSYVHDTVVQAFENGMLSGYADTLKGCRSPARREQIVAEVLASIQA